MKIEYQIVPHKGDWAVSIDGKIYDSSAAWTADFPLHAHNSTKFFSDSDIEFGWHEMFDDIVLQWE